MKRRGLFVVILVALLGSFTSGCEGLIMVTTVGAGKSATIEDTGFFQNYDGLKKETDPRYPELPDFWYLAPDVKNKLANYKTVLMPDFTALTAKPDDLLSIQSKEFKTIKKDLPDSVADMLEGSSVFPEVVRISEKIRPRNIDEIKKLHGDAILMGNIKEIVLAPSFDRANEAFGLAAAQVEIKLVDIKTGEEVLKSIHRGTSDADKVGLVIRLYLTDLFKKAKGVGVKEQK